MVARAVAQGQAEGRRVMVVSTYASAGTVEQAKVGTFGLIVCDEAHRMASGEALDDIGTWSKPLFDAHIPAQDRIHFTATLRPEGSMDHHSQALAMNNVEVFGPVAYSLDYARARDRGILAPIVPHIVPLDAVALEVAMEEAGAGPVDGEGEGAFRARRRAFAASLMVPASVEKARADNGQASVMVLCPPGGGGAHAETVARVGAGLLGEGVNVAAVHGKGATDVQTVLDWGRSPDQESVIAVVDMLREGTDMAKLNTLIVARPADSHVLLTQSLGRITRLHPPSWNLPPKVGNVMVPVIVDSRQDGAVVDGEVAANFVSSFVRLDARALQGFQQAQLEDGRASVETNPLHPSHQGTTATALGTLFNVDATNPMTARVLEHIAAEVAGRDSIGHTHHMMGRYLNYVEEQGLSESDKVALAPSRSKKVGPEHNRIAVWVRSVTEGYAHGRLSAEEATLLESTPGFALAHGWDAQVFQGCVEQAVQRHGMFPGSTSDKAGHYPGLESLETGVSAWREAVLSDELRARPAMSAHSQVPEQVSGDWREKARAWWSQSVAKGEVPSWAPPFPGTVRAMEGVLERDEEHSRWVLIQPAGRPVMAHAHGDEHLSDPARAVLDKVEAQAYKTPAAIQRATRHPAVAQSSLALPLRVDPSLDAQLAAYAGRSITCQVRLEASDRGDGIGLRVDQQAIERIGQDTKEATRRRRNEAPSYVTPQVFALSRAVQRLHKEGWPPLGMELLQQGFTRDRKMFAGSPITLGQTLDQVEAVREDLVQGKLSNGDIFHLNRTPGFDWTTSHHLTKTVMEQGPKGSAQPRNAFVRIASALHQKGESSVTSVAGLDGWGREEALRADTAFGRTNLMALRVVAKERHYRKQVAKGVALGREDQVTYKATRQLVQELPESRALFGALVEASDRDPALHKERVGLVNAQMVDSQQRRARILQQEATR